MPQESVGVCAQCTQRASQAGAAVRCATGRSAWVVKRTPHRIIRIYRIRVTYDLHGIPGQPPFYHHIYLTPPRSMFCRHVHSCMGQPGPERHERAAAQTDRDSLTEEQQKKEQRGGGTNRKPRHTSAVAAASSCCQVSSLLLKTAGSSGPSATRAAPTHGNNTRHSTGQQSLRSC
jgi:hypothetical protein